MAIKAQIPALKLRVSYPNTYLHKLAYYIYLPL